MLIASNTKERFFFLSKFSLTIDPFLANISILYSLKTPEKPWRSVAFSKVLGFSDAVSWVFWCVFIRYKIRTLTANE